MVKVIGLVGIIFFGIVFVYFFLSLAGSALPSLTPSLTRADSGPANFRSGVSPGSATNPTEGLSVIDFSIFAKNGTGTGYITQGYGNTPYAYLYVGHWHNGIDIAAQYGAPIYSPVAGTILATGNQDNYCAYKGFGKFIALSDEKYQVVVWFAHLGTILVSPGDVVNKGTELGTVGTTGLETGPHLHLSVFALNGFSMKDKYGCGPDADGQDMNPLKYLESVY